jgi:hypothetical protein
MRLKKIKRLALAAAIGGIGGGVALLGSIGNGGG